MLAELDDELVLELTALFVPPAVSTAAFVTLPEGVTANQIPPSPWPFAWPVFLSSEYRYRARPL